MLLSISYLFYGNKFLKSKILSKYCGISTANEKICRLIKQRESTRLYRLKKIMGASDISQIDNEINSLKEEIRSIKEVFSVDFGRIGQWEWELLDIRQELALVITKEIIFTKSYNINNSAISWKTCSLRNYLNNNLYPSFSKNERAMISTTSVVNAGNPYYGTIGCEVTEDNIFLLSLDEAKKYFYDDSVRKLYLNNVPCRWWCRTPGSTNSNAVIIDVEGYPLLPGNPVEFECGVRPAMWINLNMKKEEE